MSWEQHALSLLRGGVRGLPLDDALREQVERVLAGEEEQEAAAAALQAGIEGLTGAPAPAGDDAAPDLEELARAAIAGLDEDALRMLVATAKLLPLEEDPAELLDLARDLGQRIDRSLTADAALADRLGELAGGSRPDSLPLAAAEPSISVTPSTPEPEPVAGEGPRWDVELVPRPGAERRALLALGVGCVALSFPMIALGAWLAWDTYRNFQRKQQLAAAQAKADAPKPREVRPPGGAATPQELFLKARELLSDPKGVDQRRYFRLLSTEAQNEQLGLLTLVLSLGGKNKTRELEAIFVRYRVPPPQAGSVLAGPTNVRRRFGGVRDKEGLLSEMLALMKQRRINQRGRYPRIVGELRDLRVEGAQARGAIMIQPKRIQRPATLHLVKQGERWYLRRITGARAE